MLLPYYEGCHINTLFISSDMDILIAGDFSLQGRVSKLYDAQVLNYLMGGGK